MPPITLKQLLEYWQAITEIDADDGADYARKAGSALRKLYDSIGYYSQVVPADVQVPAPADWGNA